MTRSEFLEWVQERFKEREHNFVEYILSKLSMDQVAKFGSKKMLELYMKALSGPPPILLKSRYDLILGK
jgi:hypothetical protein